MTKKLILAICAVAALVLASAVDADVIYTGVDNGVGPGGARPNSDTAAAAFDADAGSIGTLDVIDFESLTVQYFTNLEIAPGVTATTTGTVDDLAEGGITNSILSPTALGYNTTAGGENYLRFVPQWDVGTATLTITFDTPVQAWGAYLTGLETGIAGDLYIVYDDGSVVEHEIAGTTSGGVQFFGFTDAGMLISQIVLEERNIGSGSRDIWGLDDMRYTPIPEPASMLMLGALGAGLAGARKVRRKK